MTEASGAPRTDDGARCDPEGVVVDGVRIQAPFQHPDAPDPVSYTHLTLPTTPYV